MRIGIANDHRGMELREKIKNHLTQKGYEVIDFGPIEYDANDDYPDFAFKLGEAIQKEEIEFGILICRTGIGMSIACNKVKGVRCAKVSTVEEAELTRIDNNANVIALSYEYPEEQLYQMLEKFLNTPFSTSERHQRRVNKINQYKCI